MSKGDEEALFNAWVEQHLALVGRVARSYTHTEEDCEELVQETLVQLWLSIPRFEQRAKPSTWIYRVALNTAMAWQRRDQRRQRRFRPLPETADVVQCDTKQTPVLEDVEQLYAAIRRLPKADAAILLLYLDDLSYREMADVLGITESNVGVKLHRARKALATLMKEVTNER